MTVSGDMVWEVRANGTAAGGAGFKTGASGTDYSQQDAVQITRTDIVIDATTNTKLTSAATAFTSAEVGNVINITSGTGFTAGRYEIVSEASGVVTCDRAVGTTSSTGGNGNVGGAMTFIDANIDDVNVMEPGQTMYIANDATHTLTASVSLSAGAAGTLSDPIRVIGYDTTRGDNPREGSRPLIACGAYTMDWVANWYQSYLEYTTTTSTGVQLYADFVVDACKVNNSSGTSNRTGFIDSYAANGIYRNCEAESVNGRAFQIQGFGNYWLVDTCYAHDSESGIYYTTSAPLTIKSCIIDTCTAGLEMTSSSAAFIFNVFDTTIYNCTKGIDVESPRGSFVGNIISDCTTGIEFVTATNAMAADWNNYYNNTTDVTNMTKGGNASADNPGFTDAANCDFSIGSAMEGNTSANVFPGGLSVSYASQGAIQSASGGGGGGTTANLASF